ncbi:MAG: efflux RND transporter periplasmic adaptor subunit [Rubrivivax sp.]|nr:efflux RND transporter periplasmic adaptor subunit [Rubrivivax sp.]
MAATVTTALAAVAAAVLLLAPRALPAAGPAPGTAAPPALATVPAQSARSAGSAAYDGVVEAVRQTVIAAQVSGAVVQLDARAGDRVKAGQVLLRLDARAADQGAVASEAQVRAARAAQEVAEKEVARQRQLAADRFISAAALDRAEAEYKAAAAQAAALLAQAGAARTQTGFYVVRAPYAGVVSEVPVALGDMALPGRPLVTLYDPAVLRVSAAVPQSAAATVGDGRGVRVELPSAAVAAAGPGAGAQRLHTPARVQQLPAADAATHTVTLRADLAPASAGLAGLAPGQFARLWLPAAAAPAGGAVPSPWVPVQAVVRRAEMTGLYVLDAAGRPLLRQVRLGRSDGQQVEVLAGLSSGERVATDPQAAARLTLAQK